MFGFPTALLMETPTPKPRPAPRFRPAVLLNSMQTSLERKTHKNAVVRRAKNKHALADYLANWPANRLTISAGQQIVFFCAVFTLNYAPVRWSSAGITTFFFVRGLGGGFFACWVSLTLTFEFSLVFLLLFFGRDCRESLVH